MKDQSMKNLAERIEEEVLDKYKVEESHLEAFRGRGAPLEWRKVRKARNFEKESGRRLLCKIFLLVGRIQPAASAKQTGRVVGRGRDEAAAKNGYHERSDEENQSKRKNGC